MVKKLFAYAGDIRNVGSIPESGRGNGNTFQYSSLENPMDREVGQAKAHSITELDTTEVTQHSFDFAFKYFTGFNFNM